MKPDAKPHARSPRASSLSVVRVGEAKVRARGTKVGVHEVDGMDTDKINSDSPSPYDGPYKAFVAVFGADVLPLLDACQRKRIRLCGTFERAEAMAEFADKIGRPDVQIVRHDPRSEVDEDGEPNPFYAEEEERRP